MTQGRAYRGKLQYSAISRITWPLHYPTYTYITLAA